MKIRLELTTLLEKGAFHILVGNFATKFVTFFGSIFLVRILSKADYGILGYMENLCGYAYVFAGLGLSNALIRYSVLSNDIEHKYSYYKYAVTRGFMFDILIVIGIFIINIFYNHPEKFSEASYLMPILILALPFNDLTNDQQINERAMFNNNRFAVFSVVSAIIVVLGRVFGAEIEGVTGTVFGIVVANVIVASVLIILVYRKYFTSIKAAVLTRKEKNTAMTYSLQYMITNGLWALFMLTDVYLLGLLNGDPATLADYKVAYVLPGNLSVLSSAVGLFIEPYFISNEDDTNWVRKNYLKTLLYTVVFVGITAILLGVFAKPIIWILYGNQYTNTASLMRILLLACFINCALRYTTANILAAMGLIKYNMIISVLGVIMLITMDLCLIPRFGSFGIAFAEILTNSVMAIALFVIFNNKYSIIIK